MQLNRERTVISTERIPAAGAGYKYDLLWAGWLASGMAMLLQYLSGKLGIASGYSLPELVRKSLGGRRRYVIPYWLAAEAAAAATDLAEYLGTVLALNILFGIPLLYSAVFGALDVILLLLMMGRRFRIIEQYFALLISVLVIGILYNVLVVGPDAAQVAYHSVVPLVPTSDAALIAVGMVGATVMPHALFVHSWRERKARYSEVIMNELEALFPGLGDHITFVEGASPRTMERYTLNLTGAIYGWEVAPDQVGLGRLPHKTPIRDLYLSGHWTQPGGGIYGVIMSGIQTAQTILGERNLFEELGGHVALAQ